MRHQDFECTFRFIRHGQSFANTQHGQIIGGRSPETPLTLLGIQQSLALGKRFATHEPPLTDLFFSPLVRARDTMRGLYEALPYREALNPIEVPALVELSQGSWENAPRDATYVPDVQRRMGRKTIDFTPPGGESQRMVERRFADWLEDEILANPLITRRRGPVHIGVVSHGILIGCALHYVMGIDRSLVWRVAGALQNTSVTTIKFNKDGWWPIAINDTSHLVGVT